MSRWLTLLMTVFIVGCQATGAVVSVVSGTVACSSSKAKQSLPIEGAKQVIHTGFDYLDGNDLRQFEHVAECEYQGAMCGGGQWFEIWHGDRTSKRTELELSSGDKLVFKAHSQCLFLNEVRRDCSGGRCAPADKIPVLVLFSKKHTEERKASIEAGKLQKRPHQVLGQTPDREVVNLSQLKEVDIDLMNLQVTIKDQVKR